MRRSGVRLPSAPPDGNPVPPADTTGGTGFRRCPSALLCSRASPAPRRSEAARSPDDPRCATTCSSWRSTRVRAKPELSPGRPPLASHKLAAVCRRSWIRGPGARRTQWPNASPQTRAAGVGPRGEEQIVRTLPVRACLHQREDPVRYRHPASLARLGRLALHTLRGGAADHQHRHRHADEVLYARLPQLRPSKPGPGGDQQSVGLARVLSGSRRVERAPAPLSANGPISSH